MWRKIWKMTDHKKDTCINTKICRNYRASLCWCLARQRLARTKWNDSLLYDNWTIILFSKKCIIIFSFKKNFKQKYRFKAYLDKKLKRAFTLMITYCLSTVRFRPNSNKNKIVAKRDSRVFIFLTSFFLRISASEKPKLASIVLCFERILCC